MLTFAKMILVELICQRFFISLICFCFANLFLYFTQSFSFLYLAEDFSAVICDYLYLKALFVLKARWILVNLRPVITGSMCAQVSTT